MIFPRRAGKTDFAFQHLMIKANEKVGVYAFIEPYYKLAKESIWRVFVDKYVPDEIIEKKSEPELYIKLKNGSEIYFKGANKPDSFRSFSFHGYVMDEVRDIPKETVDILNPMIKANKGWALYISTPRGKDLLYQLYKRGADDSETKLPNWKSWLYTIHETKHIDPDEIKQAKDEMSADMFRQEFECAFIESGGMVFRNTDQCIGETLKEPVNTRFYQMGVDLGRHNDFTVLTVVDCHNWEVVAYDRFNHIDWATQEARIEAMSYKYNRAKIKIDSTAIGERVMESLRYKGLSVDGITFSSKSKHNLVMNLTTKMEKRLIRIPNWGQLIDELNAYEITVTPSGAITYKNSPIVEHDDCAVSLMLAFDGLIAKYPIPRSDFYQHKQINDDPFL